MRRRWPRDLQDVFWIRCSFEQDVFWTRCFQKMSPDFSMESNCLVSVSIFVACSSITWLPHYWSFIKYIERRNDRNLLVLQVCFVEGVHIVKDKVDQCVRLEAAVVGEGHLMGDKINSHQGLSPSQSHKQWELNWDPEEKKNYLNILWQSSDAVKQKKSKYSRTPLPLFCQGGVWPFVFCSPPFRRRCIHWEPKAFFMAKF